MSRKQQLRPTAHTILTKTESSPFLTPLFSRNATGFLPHCKAWLPTKHQQLCDTELGWLSAAGDNLPMPTTSGGETCFRLLSLTVP